MVKKRKIFFVMAGGGGDIDRHYFDTIKNKRNINEASRFLKSNETEELKNCLNEQSYSVWGSIPGSGNIRTWQSMEPGDYVMIYRKGRIILVAEIAMKTHNPDLAKYFWGINQDDKTWEYIYFLFNEVEVNVDQKELNKYLKYVPNYSPQGFMAVKQDKADKLLFSYGDLISFLQKIEKGEKIEEVDIKEKKKLKDFIEEKIKQVPTIHDEMQWRLISLGNKANFDVWIPRNDQNRIYKGQRFKELVIPEFHETIDVPIYIKNIDAVWKLGYSVKSAFEIEHTTQIYSGILRLSDLRAMAPNSNYPLFIVAEREKKTRVFEQLRRPTFSNDYLHLNSVVKFLSYDDIRDLDQKSKDDFIGFDIDWLIKKAESLD